MLSPVRRVINIVIAIAILALASSPARGADAAAAPETGSALTALTVTSTVDASVLDAALAALAAETPRVEFTAPRPATLGSKELRIGMYASFVTLQALDGYSTLKALSAGGREANPVMSGVVGSPAGMFAVKAGTAAATVFLAERLAKHNKVASFVMMAALNTSYAAIVAHNYRVAGAR